MAVADFFPVTGSATAMLNNVTFGNSTNFFTTTTTTFGDTFWQGTTTAGWQGTTTGASSNWAFASTGINTRLQATWGTWNVVAEATAEQQRQQLITGEVERARQSGFDTVRYNYPTVESFLESVAQHYPGKEFTDDEARAIADGFQRGLEERLEADRRYELAQLEQQQRAQLEARAAQKAETLLLSLLDDAQREEWVTHQRITVATPDRVWRLFRPWAGGAALMGEGDVRRATLCVHARTRIPEADNVVALLMALRSGDEEHLLRTAILHAGAWTEDELAIRRGEPRRQMAVAA